MTRRSFKKARFKGLQRRGARRTYKNVAAVVGGCRGVTLVEILVAMTLALVTFTAAMAISSGYLGRTTAQRAAQVFARDLVLARSSAVRSREWVSVKFDEVALSYTIRTAAGDQVVIRVRAGNCVVLRQAAFRQATTTRLFMWL